MDDSLASPAPRQAVSWIAIALGPACWFGDLLCSYALQPIACVYAPWLLPTLAVIFLIPLILSIIGAARELAMLRATTGRQRFIAVLGVITPLMFLVVLLWSALAALAFSPCE
jgi:hypothetical protein